MTSRRLRSVMRLGACLAILPGFLLMAESPAIGADWEGSEDIAIELRVRGGEEGNFVPGQDFTFYVEADEDCYLTVYNIDVNGRVTLLFPDDPNKDTRVEGHRRYRVPERYAAYNLYLGEDVGVEYLVAVASARRIHVERWFPDGLLDSPTEIYWEEALDADGFSPDYWVEEDPYLAMDLINERLVPTRHRDEGYGEESLPLRVGLDAAGSTYPYRVDRIEIVHRYDPFWDPLWWDPLYVDVHWYHPLRYSYYGSFWGPPVGYWGYHYYDPFWDAAYYYGWSGGWWVSASYGWGPGFHWSHHPQTVYYHSPDHYWGSQVKWKTYRSGVTGDMTRFKGTRSGGAAQVTSLGIRTPASPAAKYRRLEPRSPAASRAGVGGDNPAVRSRGTTTWGGETRGDRPAATPDGRSTVKRRETQSGPTTGQTPRARPTRPDEPRSREGSGATPEIREREQTPATQRPQNQETRPAKKKTRAEPSQPSAREPRGSDRSGRQRTQPDRGRPGIGSALARAARNVVGAALGKRKSRDRSSAGSSSRGTSRVERNSNGSRPDAAGSSRQRGSQTTQRSGRGQNSKRSR